VRLKYALRALAASPSFTVGSILCLSTGLALTIAAFSLVNAAFFGALPGVHDRGTLRNVSMRTASEHGRMITAITQDEYNAFRAALADVADVTAYTNRTVSLQFGSTPRAARAVYVSPNYFSVLGTQPQLGSLGATRNLHTVVVSDRFWRIQMNGRSDAVGQVIQIDRRPFTVVAVAPRHFNGPSPGEFEEDQARIKSVWLPLAALPARADADPSGRWLAQTARVKPGVTDEQLETRATAIAAGLSPSGSARIRPLHLRGHEDSADAALTLALIMSVPFGILAIACANVANLLLARGTSRMREVAVRLALGASRRRIVTELLAESVILATGAAAVALGTCWAGTKIVETWIPLSIAIDWRVATFALAAAVVTAMAFGLWPALGFSRAPMTLRLQDIRPVRTRTRRLLVASQLALSTSLVVMAALLVRAVGNMSRVGERTIDTEILAVSLDLGLGGYDQARGEALVTAVVDRVRALPAVVAAGAAPDGPFRSRHSLLLWPAESGERRLYARGTTISEGWLEAAGVRLLEGRDFTPQERRGTPSGVLVSESLVRAFWPEGNALGRTLLLANPLVTKGPRYTVQVIGVVSDGTDQPVERIVGPVGYLPSPISYEPVRSVWARTQGDAEAVLPQVRAIVASLAPDVPITDLTTLAGARTRDAGPFRWLSQGMTAAGLLSLLLAALGLFSLLTYLVAQRRREMGIRMALGARRQDIVRLVVGESALVCVGGTVIGGLAALGIAATLLRDMIRSLHATDPLSLVLAAGVLLATAFAASAHPALRAARTDPSEVLRAE
jgi:predicted permease